MKRQRKDRKIDPSPLYVIFMGRKSQSISLEWLFRGIRIPRPDLPSIKFYLYDPSTNLPRYV